MRSHNPMCCDLDHFDCCEAVAGSMVVGLRLNGLSPSPGPGCIQLPESHAAGAASFRECCDLNHTARSGAVAMRRVGAGACFAPLHKAPGSGPLGRLSGAF
jgi:hypothetical protein